MSDQETIREQFMRMDGERSERIRASEMFAYYTIPSIFPKDSNGDNSEGVGMLDSIGSAVANHFANKLVTTLFSPNRPFFRMEPDADSPEAKEIEQLAMDESNPEEQKTAQALLNSFRMQASRVEKDAVAHLEKISYRTAAVELAKLIVVTGDGVIKNPGKGRKPSVYNMKDYVCLKDGEGTDKILIVRDAKAFASYSKTDQDALQASTTDVTYEATTEVTVYTRYELQSDGRYKVTQASDQVDHLEDAEILVTKDDMVHTHLSWNLHRGENYGRGLVEDFSGSFHMIDALSRTIAALSARLAGQKIMVHPQSNIDVDEMNSSDSGTYISGDPDMVGTQKLVDAQDIVTMDQIIQGHKRQISAAFLYSSGHTRDAERVTAEEIRENAAELEIAHGGVYSRFSADWQRKAAKEAVREVDGPLSPAVDTRIITGMDSLSRQGEMQSVRLWVQDLSMLNGLPEQTQGVINQSAFATYAAVQRGVEHGSFVYTEDEIKQMQAAAAAREEQMAAQEQAARTQETIAKGIK